MLASKSRRWFDSRSNVPVNGQMSETKVRCGSGARPLTDTPQLHTAAEKGDVAKINALLDAGADIEAKVRHVGWVGV